MSEISFDIDQTSHTFSGFGSTVWKFNDNIKALYEALNLKWMRFQHEARAHDLDPIPIRGNHADYDRYWQQRGDHHSIEFWDFIHEKQIQVILLGRMPNAFKDGQNLFKSEFQADWANIGLLAWPTLPD